MSKETNLSYTRQSLRKATKFLEGDYSGINPRQFYRSLKRSLEEIQEGGDFKYTTIGTQGSDLEISSEDVGQKTGKVKGRLIATSESREVGHGEISYKRYGPHGALGMVVGSLTILIGMASSLWLAFLGLIAIIAGGYGYFQIEKGKFPVERKDVIRTLMTGEVSERTIEEEGETKTDIFANMSVIYAGDTLLHVSTSELEDIPWTQRRAIAIQIKKWFNQVSEENQVEVDEGFISYLSCWANRSLESDRTTIKTLQKEINNNFEMRIRYTDILMDNLPNNIRDELSDHQEGLMNELEELSEDMDIYVEREGLQRVE